MGLFYVLLLVPMMIQHIAIKGHYIDDQKRNKVALSFFFLLLTLLVALRHEHVGTDTTNYVHYFLKYGRMEWREIFELTNETGFLLFNKVVSYLSTHPQVYLAVTSLVIVIMIYPTYKRLCVDASLTIVLYCIMPTFFMMFSGLRQMLAVGIGFIAYRFVRMKKIFPFMLTVLLAIFVHNSAFMLAFMYPLYHVNLSKKWLYVVVPTLIGIFVFNKPIFTYLCEILEQYTRFSGTISSTGAYNMLILFAALAVFAYLIPQESNMDRETVGLRNFLLFSLVIQMFAPLHIWTMRMNYYYIVFIPLLIPRIIHYSSQRWNQVAIMGRHVMVAFFLLYFFINLYGGESLDVFPYHFFWEEVA